MSTVAEIIDAVKRLKPGERNELLERLREVDFEDAWDKQIAADATAGKLDKFVEKAISEHKAGRTTPFP